MKRLYSILVLSLVLMPSTLAARTIADFFASEPGNIFTLLTRTHRLDMVDYYNSGQVVDVPNNLAGEARLIELDSVYLKVQTSGSRVVEMLMRKAGKDTVITVIETVMTPVPDSRLTQWNVHWQQYISDRLFTAILDYPESGRAPDFTGALAMAFCFIRQDLDRGAGRRDGTRAAGTKACGAPRNGEPPRRRDGRAR